MRARRWHWRTFIGAPVTGTVLLAMGCAFTPGMQMDAGPQGFVRVTPTEPEEEDDYVLIPITDKLVAEMEADSSPDAVKIPPEWRQDEEHYVYRVGPGDELQVTVWGHPELNFTAGAVSPEMQASRATTPGPKVLVDDQGTMYFPLLNWVKVSGKTAREISEMMTRMLSRYYTLPLQIDVRVVGFRSQRVHVSGEVRQPREVPITDVPLRLLDAIAAAGGTGGAAAAASTAGASAGTVTATLKPDLEDVRIIRNGKQISVSLLDIYDRGRQEENILLRNGDTVHVPNLDAKKIYVMGEVQAPGLQAFERGTLTLAAALQKSGGLNQESAEGTRVLVLRGSENKPLVYYFNYNQPKTVVLSTRFPLKQSDVVYVATADISKFQRVVQAFLPILTTGMLAGALVAGGR